MVLHEVEVYLFNCPAWGIGAESVQIFDDGCYSDSMFPYSLGNTILGTVNLNKIKIINYEQVSFFCWP